MPVSIVMLKQDLIEKEYMKKEIMDDCLYVFKKHNFKVMDITGGAPEMMPNFEYLVEESRKIAKEVIIRTNLTILLDEKYSHLDLLC